MRVGVSLKRPENNEKNIEIQTSVTIPKLFDLDSSSPAKTTSTNPWIIKASADLGSKTLMYQVRRLSSFTLPL